MLSSMTWCNNYIFLISTFFSSDSWFLEYRDPVFISVCPKNMARASGTQWMSMKAFSGWLKFSCLSMPTRVHMYSKRMIYLLPGGGTLWVLGHSCRPCAPLLNSMTALRAEGTLAKTQEVSFHQGLCITEAGSPCPRVGFQDTGRQ